MLPAIYLDAHLRNATPVCPQRGRLGVGFEIAGQPAVRVGITRRDARILIAVLTGYLNSPADDQSAGSSLIPSEAVSVPSDGVKV